MTELLSPRVDPAVRVGSAVQTEREVLTERDLLTEPAVLAEPAVVTEPAVAPSDAPRLAVVRATLGPERGLAARLRRLHPVLLVGGLMVVATALRLPNVGRAFWVDEGISVGIASHPLSELPHLLRLDGSPPLFYALLHFWVSAFGTSELATHALPLLLSLLVVPVAWWCGGALFGSRGAVAAAVLAATNPFLNWYATETRMYPLVCGLAMVAVTATVRALRHDRPDPARARDGVAAAIALLALLYTHNWGLYLTAVIVAAVTARSVRRRDQRDLRVILVLAGVVGVAYLPWMASFLAQAGHTAAPWAVPPGIGDFFADPTSTIGGTLGVIVVPVFALGVLATWRTRSTDDSHTAAWVCGIAVATLLLGWIAAQVEPSWATRYLAVTLGPFLLAIAGALGGTARGRKVLAAMVALMVGGSVIGSLLPDTNARYAKSNVAAVAAAARPFLQRGDVVVVTQTEQLAVLAHYLPPGLVYLTPTGPVADSHVVDWRNLIPRLASADLCATVAPTVDGLSPGGHVLVVNPLRKVGASGTLWSRTVNADVLAVNRLMLGDPALRTSRSFTQATKPKPFSAVTGLLFTKLGAQPACQTGGAAR